jgi:CMP-N-acetylneuraminic acid synthetase
MLGAEVPFLRDKEHSRFDTILELLMQYVLCELEKRGIIPDILVMMEIQYPLRNDTLIDELISELVVQGLDTVIPAKIECSSSWMENDGAYDGSTRDTCPVSSKSRSSKGLKV